MKRVVRIDRDLAGEDFRHLPPDVKKRFRQALRDLQSGAEHVDVKELDTDVGEDPVYRLRVGDWRAAFVRVDEEYRVIRIFHRSRGYAWLADRD